MDIKIKQSTAVNKPSASKMKQSREETFEVICTNLKKNIKAHSSTAAIAEGDSLSLIKKLPSNSISLILTDPPYHSTKKKNIHGDTAFEEDKHFLEWMSEYIAEWRRILKPNGSIFCFCSSTMAARLEILFRDHFNVLSQVVWTKPNEPGFDGWKQKMKKESLRQWYEHTERIIFAEPAHEGNLFRSYFGNVIRAKRKESGLSGHELTELVGAYGKVNHGGAVSNWEAGRNVPSREQYEKICDALIGTGKVKEMPAYEDVVRPFMVDATKEFTDVWNFPSVRPYKGKHPAEKPLSMLEHAIVATTFEGDIVLDCFAGSGNTHIAASRTGRKSVMMEIDPKWTAKIAALIDHNSVHKLTKQDSEKIESIAAKEQKAQMALFSPK